MKLKPTSMLNAFFIILFTCSINRLVLAEEITYAPAAPNASTMLRTLEKRIRAGEQSALPNFWTHVKHNGAPLIEAPKDKSDFSYVTFLWQGDVKTQNVVIFDGVAGFDAKDRMTLLPGTNVWYKTYRVRNDARFAYNLSPNDSLQSINEIKDNDAMKVRLAAFQTDPLNPHRCPTTLEPTARTLPTWNFLKLLLCFGAKVPRI